MRSVYGFGGTSFDNSRGPAGDPVEFGTNLKSWSRNHIREAAKKFLDQLMARPLRPYFFIKS